MKLTIGNVTLDNNVILAPMAGVTDLLPGAVPGAGLRSGMYGDGQRQGGAV